MFYKSFVLRYTQSIVHKPLEIPEKAMVSIQLLNNAQRIKI